VAVAVWWEALTIIRRYPVAAVVPAVLLGALGQSPYYIIESPLNLSEVMRNPALLRLIHPSSLLEDQHHPVPPVSPFRSGSSFSCEEPGRCALASEPPPKLRPAFTEGYTLTCCRDQSPYVVDKCCSTSAPIYAWLLYVRCRSCRRMSRFPRLGDAGFDPATFIV
jgi:hypothetical protein